MAKLTMAYSPCPNDTFMFHDVAAGGLASSGYEVAVYLHDVETLNRMALKGTYDLTKVSFHAYLLIRNEYQLLNAGAALGFGCGPLLVSRGVLSRDELSHCRIAIPGELTTAHLLMRFWAPEATQKVFVSYDQVMPMILAGEVDCGVIIHESRFVYQDAGLTCIADLGEWWEKETGGPIPLGCIVARKSLGSRAISELEALIRRSIRHSQAVPEAVAGYVRQNAIETSVEVQAKHIAMFVNAFSLDLGDAGRAAVAKLEQQARKAGIIP